MQMSSMSSPQIKSTGAIQMSSMPSHQKKPTGPMQMSNTPPIKGVTSRSDMACTSGPSAMAKAASQRSMGAATASRPVVKDESIQKMQQELQDFLNAQSKKDDKSMAGNAREKSIASLFFEYESF